MTLSFSKKFPWGEETHFVEKIWEGLLFISVKMNAEEFLQYGQDNIPPNYERKTYHPKIHTIRADRKGRWKPGNKIHLVTGNRTKDRNQFAPVLECVSVQTIEIKPAFKQVTILPEWYQPKDLTPKEIEILAKNDGFDSVDDFWRWFDKDFQGSIIHWTDLKY